MTKTVLNLILRFLLNGHNLFYDLASKISVMLESDKIHPKHKLMDYHRWFIEHIRGEWEVLDVGCGNGAFTADLANHCRKVVGIDISARNIREAGERTQGKAELICGDVAIYKFDRKFDAVILSNVLEHIHDRINFLKMLLCCSNTFLIRVPLIDRDWITLYKKEKGIEYRLDLTHSIEYTLESFTQELSAAGLMIESYRVRYGEIYAVAKKTAG